MAPLAMAAGAGALEGGTALLDPPAVEVIPDAGAGRLNDHTALSGQRLALLRQPDGSAIRSTEGPFP
jgi:hypothetical protein